VAIVGDGRAQECDDGGDALVGVQLAEGDAGVVVDITALALMTGMTPSRPKRKRTRLQQAAEKVFLKVISDEKPTASG
jgi:hypothetical protein